jgi:hypothetical protein
MRQHVRDAEMRRLVEEVYRLAWEEVAHHFHAPTRQWAGPHSRAYQTLLPGDTLALLERSPRAACRSPRASRRRPWANTACPHPVRAISNLP